MTMAQTADDTLLRVKGLAKHFTLHGDIYSKLAGEKTQVLKAVDGIDFHIKRGETLGLVGESGCGKSTTARLVTRLIEPTGGRSHVEGRGPAGLLAQPHEGGAQGGPDGVPGPLQLAQSAQDHHAHPEPADGDPRARALMGREARAGAGAAAPRRARHRAYRPLSPRILGRPAPAHRHRPRAVGRSRAGDRRRAGVGARRLDPGADPEPVPRAAEGIRADLPLHRPRPQRHPPHQRPGGGDVCRQDRRDRTGGVAVRQAAPSLHQGAAGGRPRGRSVQAGAAADPAGRGIDADRSAAGLPAVRPLPA